MKHGIVKIKLLLGALIGILSQELISLVATAQTSSDVLNTLAKIFANPSRGHLKQIQEKLHCTKKFRSQSISDYMNEIKSHADQLDLLGKTRDPEDLTDHVLCGLDPTDYGRVVHTINARDTPIMFLNHYPTTDRMILKKPSIHHRLRGELNPDLKVRKYCCLLQPLYRTLVGYFGSKLESIVHFT